MHHRCRSPPAQVRNHSCFSFDNPVTGGGALADPMGFAASLPERVILDEVQRVPALFEAIKLSVDRERLPGRFLLTGSTDILPVPKLSDSLAGRLQIVRLHPLAQHELSDPQESSHPNADFLSALFGQGFPVFRCERLGPELAERIVVGGYPAALARPTARRSANWHRDYVEALIRHDVQDLAPGPLT